MFITYALKISNSILSSPFMWSMILMALPLVIPSTKAKYVNTNSLKWAIDSKLMLLLSNSNQKGEGKGKIILNKRC